MRCLRIVDRGEGGSVETVAAGVGADEHDQVAYARCLGSHDAVGRHDADTHGVDERIARERWVEENFTADGRDAQAVAVSADSGDHVFEQVSISRLIEGTEAQRVQDCNWARAHGENVAHDAAHTSGGAFIWFDRAGMIVRFDLEHRGEPIADVDGAGIFPWSLQDPIGSGGQPAEDRAGVFVPAMLAPHRAEHAKLNRGWLAGFEELENARVFVVAQGDFAPGAVGDRGPGGFSGHLYPHPRYSSADERILESVGVSRATDRRRAPDGASCRRRCRARCRFRRSIAPSH